MWAAKRNPAKGNGRVSEIDAEGLIRNKRNGFDRRALLGRRGASRALDRILQPGRVPDLDVTCPHVRLTEEAA